MSEMVIVDNSILCFGLNMDNGVPIRSFYRQDKSDEELLYMANFLDDAIHYPDMRDYNKIKFRLSEVMDKL